MSEFCAALIVPPTSPQMFLYFYEFFPEVFKQRLALQEQMNSAKKLPLLGIEPNPSGPLSFNALMICQL